MKIKLINTSLKFFTKEPGLTWYVNPESLITPTSNVSYYSSTVPSRTEFYGSTDYYRRGNYVGMNINRVYLKFKGDDQSLGTDFALWKIKGDLNSVPSVTTIADFSLSASDKSNGYTIISLDDTIQLADDEYIFAGSPASATVNNNYKTPVGYVSADSDKSVTITNSNGKLSTQAIEVGIAFGYYG